MQTARIATNNTHGTGCTFSAALTAFIGSNLPIDQAILEAKKNLFSLPLHMIYLLAMDTVRPIILPTINTKVFAR